MARNTRQKEELHRLQGQLDHAQEELEQEKKKYDVVRKDMRVIRKINVDYKRQLRDLQNVCAKQGDDYAELLSL